MNSLIKRRRLFLILILILVIAESSLVSASWYAGVTHVHTGFSTIEGVNL